MTFEKMKKKKDTKKTKHRKKSLGHEFWNVNANLSGLCVCVLCLKDVFWEDQ